MSVGQPPDYCINNALSAPSYTCTEHLLRVSPVRQGGQRANYGSDMGWSLQTAHDREALKGLSRKRTIRLWVAKHVRTACGSGRAPTLIPMRARREGPPATAGGSDKAYRPQSPLLCV